MPPPTPAPTCGILVPQTGLEPTYPALEGRFLTTGPPGKSQVLLIKIVRYCVRKLYCPFHLGHSVFNVGCFMKKLRLSQVTWCYPLLSQTASFSKHPSTSESLLCKFLKNKRWFLILLTCFAVNHGPFQVSGSHRSLKWLCQ